MENIEFLIDNSGKRRKAIRISCDTCNTSFLKRVKWVTTLNFCSTYCKGLHKKHNIEYECHYCESTFISDKSRIDGSKSGLLFCSRKCKDIAQRVESNVVEIQPSHYGTGHSKYRDKAFRHFPHECHYCKYSECKEILEVHHIDSNRRNAKLDNLVILCPNHHAAISRNVAIMGKDKIFHWLKR